MRLLAVVSSLVLLGACLDPRAELGLDWPGGGLVDPSGSNSPGDGGSIGEEPSARFDDSPFAGDWMIDQPTHATYEASFYRFHADGRLEHLETVEHGGFGADYVTGTVAKPDRSVTCRFAETWRASDARTLHFGSRCTDDVAREIVLDLKTETPGDWGYEPGIVSVGGEPGWIHADFDWRFLKCRPDRSNCQPL